MSEYQATYGANKQRCTIFVCDDWYASEGSINVNKVAPGYQFYDGINIETICDIDTFTADNRIESFNDLETELTNNDIY